MTRTILSQALKTRPNKTQKSSNKDAKREIQLRHTCENESQWPLKYNIQTHFHKKVLEKNLLMWILAISNFKSNNNENSGGRVNFLVDFSLHSHHIPKFFLRYLQESESKLPRYCWVKIWKCTSYPHINVIQAYLPTSLSQKNIFHNSNFQFLSCMFNIKHMYLGK